MALSRLLLSVLVALAGAQREECLPTGECGAPSTAMLQSRSRAVAQKTDETDKAQERKAAGACPDSRRKIAIFMDGTLGEIGVKCGWLTSQICDSNIVRMYKLAKEIPEAQQVSYYEPGVASSQFPDESVQFGIGVKNHMVRTYRWLSENYQSCDELLLFGFSRGALSARMLQGILHRVGLAKPGHAEEAEAAHFASDASLARAFKASDKSLDVKVKFFGLFEGVLRTLLAVRAPFGAGEHDNTEKFHLQMTSTVQTFVHAMGLTEYREILDTNELYTAPETHATQAWFLGQHNDVGGGYPSTRITTIAMGWVLDKAVEAGLLLPADWRGRPENSFNILGDTYTELGLDKLGSILNDINFEKTLGIATVRNPAICRAEMNKTSQKILIHQSVKDRMSANNGWVPLQWCCPKVQQAMESFGYEYVTSEHYDTARTKSQQVDPWFKVSFKWLRGADLSETWLQGHPEYYLKVTNWHSEGDGQTPSDAKATGGCCHELDVKPTKAPEVYQHGCLRKFWGRCVQKHYKAHQSFSDVEVVLPHEATLANELMVELHEEDWSHQNNNVNDDYLGRGFVKFSDFGSWQTLDFGRYGTLEVRADFIDSGAKAVAGLGGNSNDRAQCLWLDTSTGLSRSTLCDVAHKGLAKLDWLFGQGPGNPGDCAGHIEDTKTGAL